MGGPMTRRGVWSVVGAIASVLTVSIVKALIVKPVITKTFYPTKDTYISAFPGEENDNHGSDTILKCDPWRPMLVSFDVSELAGKTINNAILVLPVGAVDCEGYSRGNIEIKKVLADWNESSVTWNTHDWFSSDVCVHVGSIWHDCPESPLQLDLTGLWTDIIDNGKVNVYLIPATVDWQLNSREHSTKPYLEVVFS